MKMTIESNLEFMGKLKLQRLTSLEEDFKREQAQFREDELDRALRRAGKLKPDPIETSYERYPEQT